MRAVDNSVIIDLSVQDAEALTLGLSDLLCWCRGFNAALGQDDLDRRPMGVETTRQMNEILKRALDKAAPSSSQREIP
jgi:hypothetical protein